MCTAIRLTFATALVAALQVLTMCSSLAADPPKPPTAGTPATLTLDTKRTAVLVMDYQNDVVDMVPSQEQAPLLDRAAALLAEARQAGLPVIYVVVRFREGYPEVSSQNPRFLGLKQSGRMREGTPGAEIHARVAPKPGDIVVTKSINTLVLAGIATSGVVLSTVRWAADMDYQLAVVADACADRDPEVHRVLTQKVFPAQATVVSTADAVKAISQRK